MAYIPQQIPKEEENKFGSNQPTTPLPPQTGGSSGSGDVARNAAPGVGTSTQFGSNAAKLSDYLKANEPQVAEFGNQVAGKLGEQYQTTMGNINQGYGNFQNQVNQGYAQPNEDLINQAAANPTEFVKNQDNVKGFQSLYNNQYKGPQNFESSDTYAGLNNDVNKAVENAGLVSSQSGLGSYLNNFVDSGKGNMTPGMQTLNTALLQRSPEARQKIQDAAKPFTSLTDYLGTKKGEANKSVESAKQAAEQSRTAAQNKFTGEGGLAPEFQKGLQEKLTSARAKENADAALQQQLLGTGKYYDQFPGGKFGYKNPADGSTQYLEDADMESTLKDMGLTRDELSSLLTGRDVAAQGYGTQYGETSPYYAAPQNINLNDYFTATPGDAMSLQNASTPEDYAYAQALAQLTGNNELALPGQPQPGFNSSAFDKESALARVNEAREKIRKAQEAYAKANPPVDYSNTSGGGSTGGTSGGYFHI